MIIPTYMNRTKKGTAKFTPDTYKAFFARAGYTDVTYTQCEGTIPCTVAVIRK